MVNDGARLALDLSKTRGEGEQRRKGGAVEEGRGEGVKQLGGWVKKDGGAGAQWLTMAPNLRLT
jgi:hypothetical protein